MRGGIKLALLMPEFVLGGFDEVCVRDRDNGALQRGVC